MRKTLENLPWAQLHFRDGNSSELEPEGKGNVHRWDENRKVTSNRFWVPEGCGMAGGSAGDGSMSHMRECLELYGNKCQTIKDDLEDVDCWRWLRQAGTEISMPFLSLWSPVGMWIFSSHYSLLWGWSPKKSIVKTKGRGREGTVVGYGSSWIIVVLP